MICHVLPIIKVLENLSIILSKALPYWKNNKQPEDVNTSEEESARFDCQALGRPKPNITWYINGVPLKGKL